MADAAQPDTEVYERIDPRIRRTRQMLFEALESLLLSRSIEEISVADIAAQASLNRGTFYDHYPDKFALLEGLVRAKFQQLLSQRGVQFDGTCAYALMGITLATCDYLASLPQTEGRRVMDKHLEVAISSVVGGMILGGLRRHPPQGELRPELMAAAMAGAIHGAAREWASGPGKPPAEEVALAIFELFRPLLVGPESGRLVER